MSFLLRAAQARQLFELKRLQTETLFDVGFRRALETGRRERLRDHWALNNNSAQTMVIVTTLMLGSEYNLLTANRLPSATAWPIVALYAVLLALAIFAHVLALWASIQLISLMSKFNIAHRKTERYACGRLHPSMPSYWRCHCESVAQTSFLSFALGTVLVIVCACLFQVARLLHLYTNRRAAVVAAVLFVLVCSVAVALVVFIAFRSDLSRSRARSAVDPGSLHSADQTKSHMSGRGGEDFKIEPKTLI
eukprot:Amastigsp_a180648_9.p2 type:complete len:250 gc:universal Amastigsp_a180648_9:2408-1659(-)